MKVKITAGTHIGIRGCYGEKTITIMGNNVEDEVKAFVFSQFNHLIENSNHSYTWQKWPGWSAKQLYSFNNEHGSTLLEYYYKIQK
jgi:hypothetical protein